MREFVIYKGLKFWIQSSGRYYQCGVKTVKHRLLHRMIWFDHHGDIHKGYIIHHKDHDWRNNDISNLELVEMRKHLSDHAKELYKNPEYIKKVKVGLDKAQKAAKLWHRSKEGKKWHSKHSCEGWKNRKKEEITCIVCGNKRETYFNNRENVRFCSLKCTKRQFYKEKREKSICKWCKKEFSHYKYKKNMYCSRKCGSNHRWIKDARLETD